MQCSSVVIIHLSHSTDFTYIPNNVVVSHTYIHVITMYFHVNCYRSGSSKHEVYYPSLKVSTAM